MLITELGHIQIAMPVAKESEARQYYAGILGLPEKEKLEDLHSRGGCRLSLAGLACI